VVAAGGTGVVVVGKVVVDEVVVGGVDVGGVDVGGGFVVTGGVVVVVGVVSDGVVIFVGGTVVVVDVDIVDVDIVDVVVVVVDDDVAAVAGCEVTVKLMVCGEGSITNPNASISFKIISTQIWRLPKASEKAATHRPYDSFAC